MAVPNTFQTATSAIPLANLDANFTYYDNAFSISGTATTFTGTATATKLIPTGSSATGNGLYLPAANSVGISTNGTNAVYINSSQNVGIGVTSVATNFRTQFLGTAGSNTSAASSGTTQSASAVLRLQAGGGFTATLDIGQGGGTGSWLQSCDTGNLATTYPLLLNPVGGNVGIGVTSVTGKFQVKAATNQSLYIGASTTIANSVVIGGINDAASANIPLEFRYGTTAAFINSGTEAMRIDSSGNVGIGTSSPTQKLHVVGNQLLANPGSPVFTYFDSTSNSIGRKSTGELAITVAAGSPTVFVNNTTESMRIDSSGNLLVNRTSQFTAGQYSADFGGNTSRGATYNNTDGNGGANFVSFGTTGTVIGTISQVSTTGVLYNTTSDQRLKENIQDAESASALIDSLQVRQFDWKSDNSHQRYGFVAQELVIVAPESVYQPNDPEEMMAVDYSKLVPMLVKEIQSLRKRLTALEST